MKKGLVEIRIRFFWDYEGWSNSDRWFYPYRFEYDGKGVGVRFGRAGFSIGRYQGPSTRGGNM